MRRATLVGTYLAAAAAGAVVHSVAQRQLVPRIPRTPANDSAVAIIRAQLDTIDEATARIDTAVVKARLATLAIDTSATDTIVPPPIPGEWMTVDSVPTYSGPAQLPMKHLHPEAIPAPTRTLVVRAGQSLQAAIDSAKRGDEIVADAGACWTGSVVLRPKAGTIADGWVTIRSSDVAKLPLGVVTEADTAQLACILTNGIAPAIKTAPGANGWRLTGIDVHMPATYGTLQTGGLVWFGDGGGGQTSLTLMPENLVFERGLIRTVPGPNQTQRCMALNAGATAIISSSLLRCIAKGVDTQAIGGWNGSGPYLVRDNILQGGSQHIMFGGADPAIKNLVAADIEITHNTMERIDSPDWRLRSSGKTAYEQKAARRTYFGQNLIRRVWPDAQVGFAVVMGSVNQGGGCDSCIVADQVIEDVVIDSVAGGFNLFQGYPRAQRMRRVHVRNVLVTHVNAYPNLGRFWQISGPVDSLQIEQITGFAPVGYLQFSDATPPNPKRSGFAFESIIGGNASYNLQSPPANGCPMVPLYTAAPYVFARVMMVGTNPTGTNATCLTRVPTMAECVDAEYRPIGPCVGHGADIDKLQRVGAVRRQ